MDYVIWQVPSLKVDQNLTRNIDPVTGRTCFEFEKDGSSVQNVPLLYQKNGIPVSVVNNWLIYLKTTRYRKTVNTQAQALLHYFIFLDSLSLSWDSMPIAPRNRPTYKFSNHLKKAFTNGDIARTTANNYLGAVVNFYKFYLMKGHHFDHKPFNYETIKVKIGSGHEFMRNNFIFTNTTDIRLNLPKCYSHGGVSRKLIPLSDQEWTLVDEICRMKGVANSNTKKGTTLVKISQETVLVVLMARYTGLRRTELITFRAKAIYKPSSEQLKCKYLVGSDGVQISPRVGVKTKGFSCRTIEVPSALMLILHQYINSPRYIKRRELFEIKSPDQLDIPPLFIAQNGSYYASSTFNARWGEIRNSVKLKLPNFNHKFHNLRSTYAVNRLKELLNSGIKEGDALDYIQSVMGHKSRSTLLHYLKFCNQGVDVNELYEQVLDKILED